MIINADNLDLIYAGFKTSYQKGNTEAKSHAKTIATTIPSSTREENYGWLGQFPQLREWIGDRVVRDLRAHSYKIKNRDFELTISIPRNDVLDDQYGVYAPMLEEMGRTVAVHPDEILFDLLSSGFTEACYDGKAFFALDHIVGATEEPDSGTPVGNLAEGADPTWFLLDLSRPIKPLIFQEREKYTFEQFTKPSDENVFWKNEFVYGVRARVNAGFGLWQMAYASRLPLTAENYEAARQAMRAIPGGEGRPLGILPTHLVVPTLLEGAGRRLLINDTRTVGDTDPVVVSNEWKDSATLIVSERLPV